jgi:serine O-acetyltransferase
MEKEAQVQLDSLVKGLLESYEKHPIIRNIDSTNRINRTVVLESLENLRRIVFPGYFEMRNLKQSSLEYHVGEMMENIQYNLTKQTARALLHRESDAPQCLEQAQKEAADLVNLFLNRLPSVRELLATDVQAGYDGDPAAFNTDEIILSYPGLYAIFVNRIAHELYLLGIPLIPRTMTEYAHSLTGIDIHPGARIGEYFFIDHGTGVVVGETTEIGNNVKIYQGVTLGALSTRGGQGLRNVKRHPTLEDRVTVYSGASILGGETRIGTGAVIGSNAFVTSSVPANTRVSIKNPELMMKNRSGKTAELGQEGFFNRKEVD